MDDDDEDILEPKEPQVTSAIQEERISARSLRIQRRESAAKRLELLTEEFNTQDPEKIVELALGDEEISPVERQTIESAAVLEHLLADGEENVTNVRVASDAREVERRFLDFEKNKEILDKLENDAKLAEERFNVISQQWAPILEMSDPLQIDEETTRQKEKCDELIEQKNLLIEDLKKELKVVDDIFYNDLKKQMADIQELSDRIDTQVQLMKNAYRNQLTLIETSIELERETTAEYNQKRWEALYKRRGREELENVEKKIQLVKEFQQKMDLLKLEHREKFRATKIQLETEIQALQQELQHLKAVCLINSEKIDYNYQVLKRREEENLFVRSQQKRKLNKMQDIVNGLKRKIKNAERDGAAEEMKANKEIKRLQEVMQDLQIKAEHFATVNERRYQQLWRMNKEKANNLLKYLTKMDREINAKILGKTGEFKSIKVDIMQQSDLPSYRRAMANVELQRTPSCESLYSEQSNSLDEIYIEGKNKLLSHILRLIADQAGFLIEDRLWPLLKKYSEEQSLICKLDNVFSALEISSEESILILCEFFSKYTFCPTCNEKSDSIEDDFDKLAITKEGSMTQEITYENSECGLNIPIPHSQFYLEPKMPSGDFMETSSVKLLADELEEVYMDYNIMEEETKIVSKKKHPLTVLCNEGHFLKISPVHVLAALQEFVTHATKISEDAKRPTVSKLELAISRKLKIEDVAAFWARYKDAVSTEKEKLWDGIIYALTRYLPILKERHNLNEEVTKLRRQNQELKNLLRGQIPTKEFRSSNILEPINRKKLG